MRAARASAASVRSISVEAFIASPSMMLLTHTRIKTGFAGNPAALAKLEAQGQNLATALDPRGE
jgi:hypothetical protein